MDIDPRSLRPAVTPRFGEAECDAGRHACRGEEPEAVPDYVGAYWR